MWTVGITETCERLGVFATHDEAAEFISTLPDFEQGIYWLDGPCNLPAEILPGGWAGDDNDLDLYFDTLDEMEEERDDQ